MERFRRPVEERRNNPQKGEPDTPVPAHTMINGEWIKQRDRWEMCPQSKAACWDRHVNGNTTCNCGKCRRSTEFPKLVNGRLKRT